MPDERAQGAAEEIKWEHWTMPKMNPKDRKWFFRHEDSEGTLLKNYGPYDSEFDALAAHKRMFINAVMGDHGLREA